MSLPSVQELEAYIRQAAQRRGIDPDTAVRVARSEGLAPNTWQSNVINKQGQRETSYGPYQLLVGGGLGDKFIKSTGKHPSDPTTAYSQVDFALDEAKAGGWSPWYGAAKVGVGNWTGIRDGGVDPYAAMPDGKKGDEQYRPVLGSMAPGGGGNFAGASPIPQGTSELAGDGKEGGSFWDRLAAAGEEFSQAMPPPPRMPHSPFGGDARQTGNALAEVLNNPTMADALLRKRMPWMFQG